MRRIQVVLAAWLLSGACHAACDVQVPFDTLQSLHRELGQHASNLRTIARAYGHTDPKEMHWLGTLTDAMIGVRAELGHLSNLAIIRNGITGRENQRLVQLVLRDALAGSSEIASISKDLLLESSTTASNPSAAAIVARAIPAIDAVVNLGNSCKSAGRN